MRSIRQQRVAEIRALKKRPPRIDSEAPARLLGEQNLPAAVAAAAAVAVLSALLWANAGLEQRWYYLGLAGAVGFGSGFVVRRAGRGVDDVFGLIAGGFAALACLAGSFVVGEIGLHTIASMMIAGYVGHWFAFREITKAEADALWRHRMGVLDR